MSATLQSTLRPCRRIPAALAMALFAVCALATPAFAAPTRPQLNITGYDITADLDPATSKLTATADVTFTALEDLTFISKFGGELRR